MKFRIVLEFDPEADSFSATCPELPGCASAGDPEEKARENIEDAIKLYLVSADIDLPRDAKFLEVMIG
jgi:predicted RNase H-like HicB family nuclease